MHCPFMSLWMLFFIFILMSLYFALYINFHFVILKVISYLLNLISFIYMNIFFESFADSWFYTHSLNQRFPIGLFCKYSVSLLYLPTVMMCKQWRILPIIFPMTSLLDMETFYSCQCLLCRVLSCFLSKGPTFLCSFL